MPDINIDIELYCAKCRQGICANGTATVKRGYPCFIIEPCDTCMNHAYSNGVIEGETRVQS